MKRSGFTLLETILALAIIVMIVGTLYTFYDQSIDLIRNGEEALTQAQVARAVLQHMTAELRCVPGIDVHFGHVLAGRRNRITFLTTAVPSRMVFFPRSIMDNTRAVQHDLRQVEYQLAAMDDNAEPSGQKEPPVGLRRKELLALLAPLVEEKTDQPLGGENAIAPAAELNEPADESSETIRLLTEQAAEAGPVIDEQILSEQIRYLEFEYYDGLTWKSTWRAEALPRAIRIIVGFDPVSDEEIQKQIETPFAERPWREDQYSVLVPLILSEELKAKYASTQESK